MNRLLDKHVLTGRTVWEGNSVTDRQGNIFSVYELTASFCTSEGDNLSAVRWDKNVIILILTRARRRPVHKFCFAKFGFKKGNVSPQVGMYQHGDVPSQAQGFSVIFAESASAVFCCCYYC